MEKRIKEIIKRIKEYKNVEGDEHVADILAI